MRENERESKRAREGKGRAREEEERGGREREAEKNTRMQARARKEQRTSNLRLIALCWSKAALGKDKIKSSAILSLVAHGSESKFPALNRQTATEGKNKERIRALTSNNKRRKPKSQKRKKESKMRIPRIET